MTNNEKDIKDTKGTQGKHQEIDEYIDQKIEEYYYEFYSKERVLRKSQRRQRTLTPSIHDHAMMIYSQHIGYSHGD